MMQMAESRIHKNNLFSAMQRFMGAVNNMDQTVMLPSMLRDMPMEEDSETGTLKSNMDDGDMYSHYQLLKSIRQDMEFGIRRTEAKEERHVEFGVRSTEAEEERHKEGLKISRPNSSASSSSGYSSSASSSFEESDEEDDEDLEKQFQYHLTGLQGVLSKLTQQANCLTKRYKQELGIGEWGKTTPSW